MIDLLPKTPNRTLDGKMGYRRTLISLNLDEITGITKLTTIAHLMLGKAALGEKRKPCVA